MVENNFCLKCEHELVCLLKQKHLDKFTAEEGEKNYLGIDVTLDNCKNFKLAEDKLEE